MIKLLRHLKARISYTLAVREAEEAHARNRQRYYVVPGMNGKLVVIDRKNFREIRDKHYISRRTRFNLLATKSYYYTPYGNDNPLDRMSSSMMRTKMKEYIAWADICHTLRIERKKEKQNVKRS